MQPALGTQQPQISRSRSGGQSERQRRCGKDIDVREEAHVRVDERLDDGLPAVSRTARLGFVTPRVGLFQMQ